ncbi:hypothetical protein [Cupriavidus sp. D39]|uniref:hypothetical protein n=1 Tax=Cupriavidus sp. D39 TaxID=2997877 RepID=UPI00226F0485|nr:hypothetical protein [Cupriavidus sp. D39]MCY0858092.1 hypothetical protein [Cupriavidus sp. D39]
MVYVTIVLTVATIGLAIYTARLFRATVRLAEDAKTNSERQGNLERPWLCVEHIHIVRREGAPIRPELLNNWYASLKWKNVGRSPARIESCVVKIEDKTTLPEQPSYENASPLVHVATLAVGENFETNQVGPPVEHGHREGDAIQFLFYGVLTYTSLGGERYRTGFAVDVSPNLPAAGFDSRAHYTFYE